MFHVNCVCVRLYNYVHRYDTYILCSYIQICYTYTYACKCLLYYTCPEVRSHCIWWGLSQQLGTWVNTINSLYKLINIWTMIKDWCISGRTVDSDKKTHPFQKSDSTKTASIGSTSILLAKNRHITGISGSDQYPTSMSRGASHLFSPTVKLFRPGLLWRGKRCGWQSWCHWESEP